MTKKSGRSPKDEKQKLLQSYVDTLKARLPDCPYMTCPEVYEGTPFSYWDRAYLIILPDKSLIFVLLAIRGVALSKLRVALKKFKKPAMAALIDPATDSVTLLGKESDERLPLSEINPSRLSTFLKVNVMSKPTDEKENSSALGTGSSPIENLQQLKPEQAFELESYVNNLIHHLASSPKNTNSEILQEAARTSLRILPDTCKEPVLAKAAISAVARTIVFLSPPDRLKAVKNILELSLGDKIGLEIKERLASVALAVAPSINPDGLAQIIRDIRPRLGIHEKISPSLAQIISFVQTRTQKN